jgi:hypothetical protein
MSQPDAGHGSRRRYWIMLGFVPLIAALLLLAFLLLIGESDTDAFVYTVF